MHSQDIESLPADENNAGAQSINCNQISVLIE